MRVYKQFYNDSQMTDMNSLARALITKPAMLSPVITHLGGREDKKFPLAMLTEGMGNVQSIDQLEYEYRVQSRMDHSRPLANTPSNTTNVGRGGAMFVLEFPDRWFIKDYVLVSQSGVQARIMSEPVPSSTNFAYTVQLINPDPNATIPAEDLVEGSLFAQLFAPVGTDFSRGNASNWTSTSLIRHKLTTIRKSYQFSGNAKDQVAEFELDIAGGKKTKLWMDYEEWQKTLQFKQEYEVANWYGQQSYNANGETQLKDENGQPIVIGPGLLEQVINKESYSTLTEKKLKDVVRDVFFGMTDADNVEVTLFTGTGGADEFDKAMKDSLTANVYKQFNDRTFVTGSGRNLSLDGYFTSYKHIDGHIINVVKVPLFDHGPVAQASRKHPETGLPLESYRMVFVDQSRYDGQNNLQMINKSGREMLRWAVAGSVIPKGFSGNDIRASDIDGASVHFLKTCGICLKRFDTSIDLQCIAS